MPLSPSSPRLPCGALSTMPFLIINLGAEMLYILQQRLRAQSIEESRTRKILGVVLGSLLQPSFVDELFKPREAYSVRATRIVFEKIAHTSVMRLNKQSMDKLFDLMAMGVKLQLLASPDPPSLWVITQTHLNGMRDIAVGDDGLVALLADATRRCSDIYARMSLGELFSLKHHLLRFFQDRDVKVSLFLEENTQRADGVIVLPLAGPVPRGHEVPGTVRYFDVGLKGTTLPTSQKVSGDFPSIFLPALPISEGPVDASSTPTKLGANLYLKERKKDITARGEKGDAGGGGGTGKKNNNNNNNKGGGDDDDDEGKQQDGEGNNGLTSSTINSPSSSSSSSSRKRVEESSSESKLSPSSSDPQSLSSAAGTRGGSETSVAGVNLLASLLGNSNSSSSSSSSSRGVSDFEIVDLFGDDEGSGGILSSHVGERESTGGSSGGSLQIFGAVAKGGAKVKNQSSNANTTTSMSSMMASLGFNDDEEDSKMSDAVSTRPKEVGAGTTSRGNMVGRESKEEEVAGSDNNNGDLLDLMDAL